MPGFTYKKIVVANSYYGWYRISGTNMWGITEDDTEWKPFFTTSSFLPSGAVTATQTEFEDAMNDGTSWFISGSHVPHKPPA
jgi:hypothetical protein